MNKTCAIASSICLFRSRLKCPERDLGPPDAIMLIVNSTMLDYCAQMAQIVNDIHAAGWQWRDCKPATFLVGRDHKLRAPNLEDACRQDEPDAPWGSPLPATSRAEAVMEF